jgi:hypothetical protein
MIRSVLVMAVFLVPVAPCVSVLAGRIPPAVGRSRGPATYHFTTEYTMLGPEGAEAGTHVVTADFVTHADSLRWTRVTVGPSAGHGQPPTSEEHQAYMEGLAYDRAANVTADDFFRAFPATANDERNLVWDELMFHSFVASLDRLRLNEPVLGPSGDVPLGEKGTFTNRRIELTLLGVGRRNGQDCFLIHYDALLNHFTVNSGPIKVSGRSDYLGDIWISLATRQIEYGTLFEEVAGIIENVPGMPGPQPLHVLRTAKLERSR